MTFAKAQKYTNQIMDHLRNCEKNGIITISEEMMRSLLFNVLNGTWVYPSPTELMKWVDKIERV